MITNLRTRHDYGHTIEVEFERSDGSFGTWSGPRRDLDAWVYRQNQMDMPERMVLNGVTGAMNAPETDAVVANTDEPALVAFPPMYPDNADDGHDAADPRWDGLGDEAAVYNATGAYDDPFAGVPFCDEPVTAFPSMYPEFEKR